MFKTILLAALFLGLGIFSFTFFVNTPSHSKTIPEGLWIENTRENGIKGFSSDPFIIEKVLGKDLILFTQISNNHPNKLHIINYPAHDDKNRYPFINLEPIYPCILSIKATRTKLTSDLKCENLADKTIEYVKLGSSILSRQNKHDSLAQDQIISLKDITKVESLNKDIHALKSDLKEIQSNLNSKNLKTLINKMFNNFELVNKTNDKSLDAQDLKTQLAEIDQLRKNINRISNYGSEIELASRLNNLEWQQAVKNWNTKAAAPAIEQDPVLDFERDDLDNPSVNQLPKKDTNASEWWKSF